MKIAWINSQATLKGGAETYIHQTSKLLKNSFNTTNILLYEVSSHADYEFTKNFEFATVIVDLKRQLLELKPDIIYLHQLDNIALLEALQQSGIPVVAFIHDHKHFCLREHKYTTIGHKTCTQATGMNCYSCLGFIAKSDGILPIKINTLSKINTIQTIYRSFDQCVVASEYMKNHLLLHNFDSKKISKITLFSDHEKRLLLKDITKHPQTFLFVGQLVRGKGIDTLLQAFAKMQERSMHLDICGSGVQEDELKALSQSLGLEERVHFHGYVSGHKLSDFYTNAYAVVIPSRAPETFNLVGVEAMKYSKAVIATRVGGISEWLQEGITGLSFDSNDVTMLTQKLDHMANNPSEVQEMGLIARAQFEKRFSPQEHINTLYQLLTNLSSGANHAF